MKAKLIFDGKEIEIEISEEFALEVTKALPVEKKKTGYERVEQGGIYYLEGNVGVIHCREGRFSDEHYECAIYHSDKTIAENNARADKLYRQLRRFAVEHRDNKIDWNNKSYKYYFYYSHSDKTINVSALWVCQDYGTIFFDTKETAQLAIDTFKDELMWYFTEYKDSL